MKIKKFLSINLAILSILFVAPVANAYYSPQVKAYARNVDALNNAINEYKFIGKVLVIPSNNTNNQQLNENEVTPEQIMDSLPKWGPQTYRIVTPNMNDDTNDYRYNRVSIYVNNDNVITNMRIK